MEKIENYRINKFPKFRSIDYTKLSREQVHLRLHEVKINEESKQCRQCGKDLPITEFYPRWRKVDGESIFTARKTICKDCQIFNSGCLEIGRGRVAKLLYDKGFRRCSRCKDIQPLDNFCKCKTPRTKGYSLTCRSCAKVLNDKYNAKRR